MQIRRISNFFTVAGVVIGGIAVLGYAFDLVPELSAAALKLVIYKLTFIGALGLVVFGALLGRLARQRDKTPPERVEPVEDSNLLAEPRPRLDHINAQSEKTPEGTAGRFEE